MGFVSRRSSRDWHCNLAAKNGVMLDGFNDVIALDDMDCRHNLIFPIEQEGHTVHVLGSLLLDD